MQSAAGGATAAARGSASLVAVAIIAGSAEGAVLRCVDSLPQQLQRQVAVILGAARRLAPATKVEMRGLLVLQAVVVLPGC